MRMAPILCSVFLLLAAAPAAAAPADDAAAAVGAVLDKFNGGDSAAFVAAHADGALITDEFAPFQWGGARSVQRWLDDYAKDSAARGITGGRVDHGAPLAANGNASRAYVVLPTTYRFKQNGKAMVGKGSMTFVMVKSGPDWKIASWTYSGATPVAE
ncbi:hypothetical protein M8312_12570 [Sphingomonas sp. KRR8]|uniref:hypothetical protein n=1 Tax=Sphingomonas sp. KRR8 TaxID=2942996 RepID=UPI00202050BA|nr:hypothetical protein [Sphingomonas sp. KRR8]URD60602.1 hypothetical protein M8312_12570 [Sphingomonas sp. KRR8]